MPSTDSGVRLLGLDVGSKRIGVAACELAGVVVPIGVIQRGPDEMDALRRLAHEREIERIVVGLPRGQGGALTTQAGEVLAFARRLEDALGLPVDVWDESFSTDEAEGELVAADVSRRKRRKVRDAVAAVVILRSYVETKGSGGFSKGL
ncbi:MAG: Holliday junction resolvase RuvX [Armatimonadota bacterium]